jgi:hypothetical protein
MSGAGFDRSSSSVKAGFIVIRGRFIRNPGPVFRRKSLGPVDSTSGAGWYVIRGRFSVGAGSIVIRGRFYCYPGPVLLLSGAGSIVIRGRFYCYPGPENRRKSLLRNVSFCGNSLTA